MYLWRVEFLYEFIREGFVIELFNFSIKFFYLFNFDEEFCEIFVKFDLNVFLYVIVKFVIVEFFLKGVNG